MRFALAALAAAAIAAPAQAAPPEVVTVDVNPGYVCVTEPCNQPPIVTVCVVATATCVGVDPDQ